MQCLELLNSDTDVGNNMDVLTELTEFKTILAHVKTKHPHFNNFYDARDEIKTVLTQRNDVGAGVVVRKPNNDCLIYFRRRRTDESPGACFERLVNNITRVRDSCLIIRISVD